MLLFNAYQILQQQQYHHHQQQQQPPLPSLRPVRPCHHRLLPSQADCLRSGADLANFAQCEVSATPGDWQILPVSAGEIGKIRKTSVAVMCNPDGKNCQVSFSDSAFSAKRRFRRLAVGINQRAFVFCLRRCFLCCFLLARMNRFQQSTIIFHAFATLVKQNRF